MYTIHRETEQTYEAGCSGTTKYLILKIRLHNFVLVNVFIANVPHSQLSKLSFNYMKVFKYIKKKRESS